VTISTKEGFRAVSQPHPPPRAEEYAAYVARQRRALLRLAVVLTNDPELAQDLVQDVLLKAHQRWSHIAGLDRPHAYVRRMLANETLSWRRKWGRIEARPDADLDRPIDDPTDAFDRRDSLLAALARLPARQRLAVVLRYFEDIDDPEIAEIMGCRPGTVRGYLFRALKTLRVDATSALATTPRS
jgi:RNA polymerase sigma-70 factor (sigma-E family)